MSINTGDYRKQKVKFLGSKVSAHRGLLDLSLARVVLVLCPSVLPSLFTSAYNEFVLLVSNGSSRSWEYLRVKEVSFCCCCCCCWGYFVKHSSNDLSVAPVVAQTAFSWRPPAFITLFACSCSSSGMPLFLLVWGKLFICTVSHMRYFDQSAYSDDLLQKPRWKVSFWSPVIVIIIPLCFIVMSGCYFYKLLSGAS